MNDMIPPQDISTEKTVLGSVLTDTEALDTVVSMLTGAAFYNGSHKKIFEAILALSNRSEPVDIVTVTAELSKTQTLDQVGGSAYLSELVENVAVTRNVAYHCKILLSAQTRRQIIDIGQWMVGLGFEDTESKPEQLIDSIDAKIYALSKDDAEDRFYHPREILPAIHADMESVRTSGISPGLSTGYTLLDKQIGGLHSGDLVIIGGRPSMGKTAFAVCTAANICKHDPSAAIAFFSLEMSKKSIVRRIISAEQGIEYQRIMSYTLTDKEREEIKDSMKRISEYNLFVDDSALMTPMQQRAKLRTLMRKNNVVLAVCDYTGLMRDSEKHHSREQEISAISRAQKRIAKEFNIPYVALCQLSRLTVQRGKDCRPALSDLRDSGAQEQDADLVMFCHREEYYDRTKDKGIAEIIIGKQRNGPTGTIRLAFQEKYMLFSNLENKEESEYWQ